MITDPGAIPICESEEAPTQQIDALHESTLSTHGEFLRHLDSFNQNGLGDSTSYANIELRNSSIGAPSSCSLTKKISSNRMFSCFFARGYREIPQNVDRPLHAFEITKFSAPKISPNPTEYISSNSPSTLISTPLYQQSPSNQSKILSHRDFGK